MSMDPTERLDDIEVRLVAQEHRLFAVLQNFFIERPKWPKGDPRRDAAARAIIWCIFFSPGTVAIAGGLIGIATLAVLVWQNALIKEQNAYFQEQNRQQQIQIESQDRVSTQSQRTRAIEVIYGKQFNGNPRIKAEAVRTLVVIERSRIAQGNNVFPSAYVNLHDADLSKIQIDNFDLKMISFRNSNLSDAILVGINLSGSAFRFANLQRANFHNSNLTETFWDSADLSYADLSGADLNGANMVRVNFRNADIDGVKNWKTIALKDAKIAGVKNAPDGFIEWATKNGAIPD